MIDYSKGKWRRATNPGEDHGHPVCVIQTLAKGGGSFVTIAQVEQQPDTKSPEAGRTAGNARLLAGAADMYKALHDVRTQLAAGHPDTAVLMVEKVIAEVERG